MDTPVTPPRLVFVDDHEDCLDAYCTLLGMRYVVFGYASPVEALRGIHTARPDVLVLDIGMRPVDGVQCLQMVRAIPGYQDVPAVAVTGFARDVERQGFVDAGFQAVIVKPVLDLEELTAVIDRLAEGAAPRVVRSPNGVHRRSATVPSAAAPVLDSRASATQFEGRESVKANGRRPA